MLCKYLNSANQLVKKVYKPSEKMYKVQDFND